MSSFLILSDSLACLWVVTIVLGVAESAGVAETEDR